VPLTKLFLKKCHVISCDLAHRHSTHRTITFNVEDTAGASNYPTPSLFLTILPVNDPPVLLIVSDPVVRDDTRVPTSDRQTFQEFNYTEDDAPSNIGQDIYLRDIDSNVGSVAIELFSES